MMSSAPNWEFLWATIHFRLSTWGTFWVLHQKNPSAQFFWIKLFTNLPRLSIKFTLSPWWTSGFALTSKTKFGFTMLRTLKRKTKIIVKNLNIQTMTMKLLMSSNWLDFLRLPSFFTMKSGFIINHWATKN